MQNFELTGTLYNFLPHIHRFKKRSELQNKVEQRWGYTQNENIFQKASTKSDLANLLQQFSQTELEKFTKLIIQLTQVESIFIYEVKINMVIKGR